MSPLSEPNATPNLAINPNIGVGPIELGMTRSQVKQALATLPNNSLDQTTAATLDYAFRNSLQVEYDANGQAMFIGVGFYDDYGDHCGCDYSFHDRHVGDYSAPELFTLFASLDHSNPDCHSGEHCFKTIGIVVSGASSEHDYRGGRSRSVYGQVCVVNQQYFEALKAIEGL
jgi:hypothetical protein